MDIRPISMQRMKVPSFHLGSVDSLNGGSTDALKTAPVEKKIGKKNEVSLFQLGPQKSITT